MDNNLQSVLLQYNVIFDGYQFHIFYQILTERFLEFLKEFPLLAPKV